MTLEVCIDSYEGALMASKFGAQRVELCAALSVGGLTPSLALMQKCCSLTNIEVHVMLRHIEGNFVYQDADIEIMKNDLLSMANSGAKGVVFGCLTTEKKVDVVQSKIIIDSAKQLGLTATFHRAFDAVHDPQKALELIIELGFDRILTSGQQSRAIDGIELIRSLVEQASGRIEIMAGGGVSEQNAEQLATTGIDALHFTSHRASRESIQSGMGKSTIPDENKIASISNLFK